MSEQKQEVLSHELLAAIGDYGYAKYRHDNDIITLGAWEDLITAIKVWNRSAIAAKDAEIRELESYICYADEVVICADQVLKMIQIDACDVNKDMVAVLRLGEAIKALEALDSDSYDGQQQAEPLIDTSAWQSCNPGCDPEFNGEKGRHCVCDPAKAAMSAKKANSINPEMVDVVGYTTAGMLRISKDLPLTGRIGAKCKPDERWNVPLMTVAQCKRIVAAKDTRIAELEAAQIEVINSRNAHQWEYERVSEELAAKDAEIARLQRNFAVEQQIANNWEAKTNELRAQLAAQQAAVPDECPHLIMFDDTDVKPIMFAGCGARTAALAKFEQISGQWNAHLFIRIARNCRDDLYPCATLAAPAAQHHGELEQLRAERDRLIALVDSPELHDFAKGVTLEAAHQRNRWGSEHDAGKEPQDWFWLVGYLAGKALRAHAVGDTEKALHHTISTAAALNNWHASITGADTSMRPGVDPARLNPSAQGEKP